MTVLVEFRVSTERFELGALVDRHGDLSAELERIVPTEGRVIPYVWVTGSASALDDLTASFEETASVESMSILDELTVGGTGDREYLYRIEWNVGELDVVRGIVDADGTILEGRSQEDRWLLRFRFPDHADVAAFYQFLADNDITDFTIESIYELRTRSGRGGSDDLSSEQRTALTLAAQRGYFETPRETTLAEIGDELGISQQATSERIRRALKRVVFSSLNIPEESPDR